MALLDGLADQPPRTGGTRARRWQKVGRRRHRRRLTDSFAAGFPAQARPGSWWAARSSGDRRGAVVDQVPAQDCRIGPPGTGIMDEG